MKLISYFDDFLRDSVNLNISRINNLESSVVAIQSFIRASDWKPTIRRFAGQGSWAHETIIKPVDLGEFDADLLVMVNGVDGWTAADYVNELGKLFRSNGTYKEMTKVWDYCVTITYANEQKIDIAPCVVGRQNQGEMEVCNRSTDAFEQSEPIQYTDWLVSCNRYSGSNSFRKVTRLLKYLRDIKRRFTCSSVLLTTLVGNAIDSDDVGSAEFADVPTALQTVIGRVDDFLQDNKSKPEVHNPFLYDEDFAASLTTRQYKNLRKSIHRYRRWVDEAIETEGIQASITAWRKLFGDQFAKSKELAKSLAESSVQSYRGILLSSGAHLDNLVDKVVHLGISSLPKIFSQPPYLEEPPYEIDVDSEIEVRVAATLHSHKAAPGTPVASGQSLFPAGYIQFEAILPRDQRSLSEYRVEWRVTNTGVQAFQRQQQRGNIYPPTHGNHRWEPLAFRGVHFVEAFIIRRMDDLLLAQSDPFYVVVN